MHVAHARVYMILFRVSDVAEDISTPNLYIHYCPPVLSLLVTHDFPTNAVIDLLSFKMIQFLLIALTFPVYMILDLRYTLCSFFKLLVNMSAKLDPESSLKITSAALATHSRTL